MSKVHDEVSLETISQLYGERHLLLRLVKKKKLRRFEDYKEEEQRIQEQMEQVYEILLSYMQVVGLSREKVHMNNTRYQTPIEQLAQTHGEENMLERLWRREVLGDFQVYEKESSRIQKKREQATMQLNFWEVWKEHMHKEAVKRIIESFWQSLHFPDEEISRDEEHFEDDCDWC